MPMKTILTLITFLLSFGIPRPAFPAQPNIVFILADDYRHQRR